jgi:tetratricopeptide (TPR) repeat protein
MALKQKDDFAGAEKALRTAIQLDPSLPDAHYTLGVVLWQTGRAPEAIECFRAAADRKPDYAEAHYMAGTILKQQRNCRDAIVEFRKTIGYQPDLAEAWLSLGQCLRQASDPAADAALAKAAELNKRKADSQAATFAFNAGLEKLKANDLAGAIERFREAVRLAPTMANAHRQLALALENTGNKEEARTHFAEARRLAARSDRKN